MTYALKKRILDLLVASILLIIFLPFWLIIPILIVLDSGWPIFFSHRRVGKGGKEFDLFKFRSMVQNADEILHSKNHELLDKFKNNDWKIAAKDDPRITRLGRFLRAFTIDEFPQLFNVFRGEMSIVGPRAYVKNELKEQTKKYPETKKYVKDILSVKPGITGPWQTSGRNEIPFKKRAYIDSQYAKNRSIIQDLTILAKTPKAMLSKW
jgi:lipopolysaccharide/colanic/teichoic acid biosynthesis glycosyltransferase